MAVNILLLQLKRIGDLIVTTPAIAALREKFPDAHITLIVSNECAALVPAISNVDRVFVVRRGPSDTAIFFTIARTKFDYCVDFTRNDRSALLTFLSGARKRIVSQRVQVKAKLRARVYNEFVPHRMRDMQTLDYNLALLEPLGIQNASRQLHLELPQVARERADALRHDAKIDSSFIVFHPGSARLEKFWEAQRWADVIDHARSTWQIDAVLTGGGSDLEQQHIREIKSKMRQPIDSPSPENSAGLSHSTPAGSLVDLSGKTDLLTLAALIAQARLLVTVDSAPMHFAAASNTPQVVLFGPTNPFHWRPRESPALILQGGSPQPSAEFSPKQARFPMSQISTQAVISAIKSLLSSPAV